MSAILKGLKKHHGKEGEARHEISSSKANMPVLAKQRELANRKWTIADDAIKALLKSGVTEAQLKQAREQFATLDAETIKIRNCDKDGHTADSIIHGYVNGTSIKATYVDGTSVNGIPTLDSMRTAGAKFDDLVTKSRVTMPLVDAAYAAVMQAVMAINQTVVNAAVAQNVRDLETAQRELQSVQAAATAAEDAERKQASETNTADSGDDQETRPEGQLPTAAQDADVDLDLEIEEQKLRVLEARRAANKLKQQKAGGLPAFDASKASSSKDNGPSANPSAAPKKK